MPLDRVLGRGRIENPKEDPSMSIYLYVGNLAASTTESMVQAAFAAAGSQTKSVVILRSPQNDRSRGFGFVELQSEDEALAATRTMNGVEIAGRPIKVGPARERAPDRSQRTSFQSYSGLGGRGTGGPRRPSGGKRKQR
jgi:RNA recognition motif-containing protein